MVNVIMLSLSFHSSVRYLVTLVVNILSNRWRQSGALKMFILAQSFCLFLGYK